MKSVRLFGEELIASLERDLANLDEASKIRMEHIDNCDFDESDCFLSMAVNSSSSQLINEKLRCLKNDNGFGWFLEYATLDNQLIKAHWCDTKYGYKLRAEMPDGSVVWTSANTKNGLAKRGIKEVWCKRPAWFKTKCGSSFGSCYVDMYPSKVNYATGEEASECPVEIQWDREEVG